MTILKPKIIPNQAIKNADGELRWYKTIISPFIDSEGQVQGVIGAATDITDLKEIEEVLRQSEARERERVRELGLTLAQLQSAQAQLIQSEKMSSLGQMIAGIAHEINNPTSFIYGNIQPAIEYAQDLLNLVKLYRQYCPEPSVEITDYLEESELDFVADDFPKLLASMQEGANRISQIVLSLRSFSRLDEAQCKYVDIHEGIDNTLLILQHRLKPQPHRSGIRVIKEYGQLPRVECYSGELNQVFMNLLSNAIDALGEIGKSTVGFEPIISIRTYALVDNLLESDSNTLKASKVAISIKDNGSGIAADVLPKIFDPFFTTKAVGQGTGLGLSISYQILVDRHGGQLRCHSTVGQGTEFVVELPIEQSTRLRSIHSIYEKPIHTSVTELCHCGHRLGPKFNEYSYNSLGLA
jgi:signal transduction histidine kinase